MTPFMHENVATGTTYQAQRAGEATMARTGEVEKDILRDLERRGPCSIEEMVTHLPGYTWNQVFSAVDRLSRNAEVTLQHPSLFEYRIALPPRGGAGASGTDATGGARLAGRFNHVSTVVRRSES